MKRTINKFIPLLFATAVMCCTTLSLSAQTMAAGGNHSIFVCASGNAKGIYFYQLMSNNQLIELGKIIVN